MATRAEPNRSADEKRVMGVGEAAAAAAGADYYGYSTVAAGDSGVDIDADLYEIELYNYRATHGRAFLRDQSMSKTQLPVLLPKGLPYAANFISFAELQQRGVLTTSKSSEVSITADELHLLYQAKCIDQNLVPSWEREVRFMELASANCKGNFFCLPENGFGLASAEAITHILSSNTTYSVLDLSGNRLRDDGVKLIAGLLKVNKTLVHVDLSSNDIGYVGGAALAEALEQNTSIISLDLGARSGVNGNHIGIKGAEGIGHVLECNQVLSRLNVSSNGLGPNGLSYIATGLAQTNTLTHLDISTNGLGYEGARIIATILEYGKIRTLCMQRNNLTDRGGRVVFQAISDAIETGADVLEFVHAEDNGFQEATAKAIHKVLSTSTALRTLLLSNNQFGAGVKEIADGLGENKHLTSISLSNCGIRETDGLAFGNALSVNTALQRLDLSKNKLKSRGVRDIAKGLGANKALISLSLMSNKVGDEGGEALGNMFLTNTTLRELNLRRNAMSNATAELFNENLRSNPSIEKMDVSYNDFSYKCFIGIQALLQKNAEANKQLIVPKLNNEIETLAPKEKELAQLEEEIEMEKRMIKDRSEQLLRKNEEARVVLEKMRREMLELDKVLEKTRSTCDEAEDVFRRAEDVYTNEMAMLKAKKTNMETRIQQEKDKADRMVRDMEKMRRQIKQLEDAEKERLAALFNDLSGTTADREREVNDAKYEAEKLAALELRKKELEAAIASKKK